ncbi:MAG TPA: hypothetical protein ENJ38_11485 [Rhodospirillales bacterium]|nr:hypothetical protein [Rhodospirillales bacterium]
MRSFLTRLVAFTVVLFSAQLAAAQSPVGTWVIDKDAMRGQLRRAIEAEMRDLTPEMRAQVAPMIDQQVEGIIAELEGSAEFREDGSVVFRDDRGGVDEGRWEMADGTIRLSAASGKGGTMVGRMVDGRMVMKPEGEEEVPFSFVFMRR